MPKDKDKLSPFPIGLDPNAPSYQTSTLGKVFAGPSKPKLPGLTTKIGFVVKEGQDPIEGTPIGRVVEGSGGAGVCKRVSCMHVASDTHCVQFKMIRTGRINHEDKSSLLDGAARSASIPLACTCHPQQ